jgi:hypothetical protein
VERYTAAGFDAWEDSQKRKSWQIAVEMANHWRRMMDVPEVNYPYPAQWRS